VQEHHQGAATDTSINEQLVVALKAFDC